MKRQNIFAAIMTLSLSLGQFSQLSVLANENPKLIKNNLFTSNTDQEAIEKAEKALEEAKKELLKAQDDVAKAKQEVTKAETSLVEKRADVTSLEKELENKDKEITQVNLKVEEYEKAYTQKREEYDSLNEKYVLLKNELENAFATLEQIKKECEAIKSNINTLTEEKKNLESEVQTQENTLAQLESETEEVRNQIQKGSLGFFESMGYTDAVRVINEGINKHQSTNLGDENDATSLENMKATLEYIKECNELRKQHGLNELQVNAQLMAIAQVQTNHTSNALGGTGHSQLYNVGENLAYGDPADGYDAFNAWYTKEKAVAEWLESHNMTWDDIKNDTELKTQIAEELGGWNAGFYGPEWVQVGHYKNIVNSSYLGTGFALNTDMRNPVMGQVFSANWSTEYNKGLMSVDAFFEQFDAYYAGLMNAQGRYEEAEEKLASMKADLQKKIDEITAANTELSAKESQKGNAQTAYDTAEGKVTDVEEDIETVENEMDEILNSEENKELANKLNTLKGEKAEILSKIEIAKGDVTKAEGILETAKETLASKEKAVKQAQKTVKEKQTILDMLLNGIDTIFDDVVGTDWFYEPVRYVFENSLMTGLNETTFGPYENLARAQFAVILHRMNDEPNIEYTNKFPDVANEQWYTDAILWASDIGVVTGYSDTGNFGPGDNINREQMAVMMYRYANYLGYDTSASADFSKFKDAKNVNEFAKEAMTWAVGAGIITGKDNETRLDPQGNASRAECATIIMRFMEYYK